MKLALAAAIALSVSMFSFAAQADSTATAGANAGASAGASINNSGKVFGGASVGGAYCVDSLVVGPFGASKSLRPCIAAQIAESAGKMGTMSRSEVRAVQLKALEGIGYTITYPAKAKASMPNITGEWKALSRAHQQAIKGCQALWNGLKIEGCTYN
jgi:hypothetical protein